MKKISLVETKAGFQQRLLEKFVQDNLPGNIKDQVTFPAWEHLPNNIKKLKAVLPKHRLTEQ